MRRVFVLSIFGLLCACPGPVNNPPASKCAGVRCTGTQLCDEQTGQCGGRVVDAGRDAGVDAGSDAGIDAGVDAGNDAGFDAGFDAGAPDAGLDAGELDAGCGSDLECFGVQHCEPVTRTCLECFLDSHCPSSVAPVCDVRTNLCVGCVSSADCLNPFPVCEAQQCLPCNTSAECGQGRECNLGTGQCDPLNDTCATARPILAAGTGTSSLSAEPGRGIDDTAGTCNAAGPELVYSFSTTSVQTLTVTVAQLAGSQARPVVFLRSSCAGTQLACDAPVSGSAGLSISSLPIGSYFLFVETANGAPGRVSLTVSLQPPPTNASNDTCASASVLSVNGVSVTRSVIVGNTTIATNDNLTEPSCSVTARSLGPDLVYSYTLGARSNVTVVARPISGSTLHPVISIRSPCPSPNIESACQAGSAAVAVQASIPGQPPGTYFVTVDSADGTTGAFQLQVDANPTVDNDTCTAPTPLTFSGSIATALGDTTWATNGNVLGDLSPSCSDSARGTGRDVVFSYTLGAAQDVTISATPTGVSPTFNPVVSLRAACADATRPGERGCVSPLAPTVGRLSLVNQPAGTYFVWVDSAADTSGPFQLEVMTAPPTPPPANDSCTSPEVLVFTNDVATVSSSTLQAANDNYAGDISPTCSPSAKQSGRDVVYQFTLTQPKDVTLSLAPVTGSSLIPALYVRRGTCTSQLLGDEVVCLNQVGGVTARQTNLAAGTYFVFVDSSGGTSGGFNLTVTQSTPTPAPANDQCAGAQALSFATNNVATASGTTFGASNSNSPTDNAPACGTDFLPRRFGRDLVYSYTLGAAQDVDVTVTPVNGSALITTLYVRSPNQCASFSAGSELACVAESAARPLRIYLPNQLAGTYFLFVDSNSYATGDFTLSVTRRPATLPPSNDTCSAPMAVLAGPAGVTGDTSGATDTYSALNYSAACRRSFFDARDLVYQYTATATGTVTATVSPEATFDAALLLLQPSCGGAQCVRFADGAGAGVPEAFSFAVTQGQTYFLVVDGWNREVPNTFGRFILTVQ